MTIFNIHKCILNYYTSVKVGSYSIGTLCTGSYSIGTLFFLAKIWRVPILLGHPVFTERVLPEDCVCAHHPNIFEPAAQALSDTKAQLSWSFDSPCSKPR